jgi:predicted RNase H-like nuclease (RuvC/YqgF family)
MNELSEFFNSVAKEKKKVEEEKIRFTPRVNIDLSKDLSSFFGTVSEAKREHVIIAKRESTKLDALQGFFNRLDKFETALQENIEKQKEEPKDDNWEETESYEIEQIEKDKTESEKKQEELEPIVETIQKVEEVKEEIKQVEVKPVNYFSKKTRPEPRVEETDVNSLAQAMSGLIKKPEQLDEQPQLSDLEKLQREFTQFKKLVSMQMASIGGGGEVRLLNLDDVDTSSLGNGKFLVFNSTTQKLEFTDQVDGN